LAIRLDQFNKEKIIRLKEMILQEKIFIGEQYNHIADHIQPSFDNRIISRAKALADELEENQSAAENQYFMR
jgi:hypothetical protein